jgi:hypothetical protein
LKAESDKWTCEVTTESRQTIFLTDSDHDHRHPPARRPPRLPALGTDTMKPTWETNDGAIRTLTDRRESSIMREAGLEPGFSEHYRTCEVQQCLKASVSTGVRPVKSRDTLPFTSSWTQSLAVSATSARRFTQLPGVSFSTATQQKTNDDSTSIIGSILLDVSQLSVCSKSFIPVTIGQSASGFGSSIFATKVVDYATRRTAVKDWQVTNFPGSIGRKSPPPFVPGRRSLAKSAEKMFGVVNAKLKKAITNAVRVNVMQFGSEVEEKGFSPRNAGRPVERQPPVSGASKLTVREGTLFLAATSTSEFAGSEFARNAKSSTSVIIAKG